MKLTIDSLNMVEATLGLPEQIEKAAKQALQISELPDHEDIQNVVVLGMGGSGIAGDVMVAAAGPLMPVPVIVCKDYGAPAFVDSTTLVFAISFSGNTEETLEAATEAYEDGARMVVVTSGGELAKLASQWSVPLVEVPRTIPQPRAAIGALSIPPLVILEKVGLFAGSSRWIELCIEQLIARRAEIDSDDGICNRVAAKIGGGIPLIYGADSIGQVAGLRWKNQINENAKLLSFTATYPELCHNELAGWGQLGDVSRQLFTLINLRNPEEHPQIARRVDLVTQILGEVTAGSAEVFGQGEGELSQLFDLMFVGDIVSLLLAQAHGVDPGPIPVLVDLKEELAKPTAE